MAKYPILKYRFEVSWGDLPDAIGFTEISGLEASTEVVEYREGNMAEGVKILQPGMQTFGEVTLKKGVLDGDDLELWKWWNQTNDGQSAFVGNAIGGDEGPRKTVTIRLLNNSRETVITWTLTRAWPIKVAFDDLNSTSNETQIQTLTLRHEGLKVAT